MMENNRTIFREFREGAPYIYVSFAHKDKDKAIRIIEQLYDAGYNVYYDSGITFGHEFHDSISSRIENSEAVVVIGSENASASQSVMDEIVCARNSGKTIHVLQMEPSTLPLGIELSLSTTQSFSSTDELINALPQNAKCSDFVPCTSLTSVTIPESIQTQTDEWFKVAASSGDPNAITNLTENYHDKTEATDESPYIFVSYSKKDSSIDPATIPKLAEAWVDKDCTCQSPSISKKDTGGSSIKKVKPQQINKVDFSVVSPEIVKPGNSSVVDIYMYTKKQRRIVDEAIKKAKEKLMEATRTTQGFSVKQGSKVTVVLLSDDAIISDKDETLVWIGDALNFKFRFSLPDEYKKKQVDFSCNILFDGIHISRLYFSVKVNTSKSVPVRFVRKDSKEAFVSYSHKDKQRVVDQIISIQKIVPKMRFWMDNQSMSAGDQWRPAIASAIKSSDVFLLFWSINAKSSSEVRKEWEYALRLEKTSKSRRSGSRFISPVPLDNPSICPPPEELSDLHFGDPSFDSDIEHIDEINFVTNTRKIRNIRKIK